jgi:hypothetical protein
MIEHLPIAARMIRNARREYGTRGTVRLIACALERRDVIHTPRRIQP